MKTLAHVRAEIKQLYKELHSWRKVGERLPESVSYSMAFRIAEHGYEPKRADIRQALGLPAIVELPPCSECGHVHVKKTCSTKRARKGKKSLFDYSKAQLLWMLENRVVTYEPEN